MIATKIIATIGPSSDSEKVIKEMYQSGMKIARLNFSHGNYEYFEKIIETIRGISEEIAILADLKGPEIRTGEVENDSITLCDDDKLEITSEKVLGNTKQLTINYDYLNHLKEGDKILIDDGLIETVVKKVTSNGVIVNIVNGGELGSKKTVSLKGHNAKLTFLSQKDKEDIDFAIKHNLDYIAASFVRESEDVDEVKNYVAEQNSSIRIISKIEHYRAIENSETIIEKSHGIMVARGDLGVEVDMEKIPKLQKEIIEKCNELGKPVIVATQMLESMKDNPRPTRAELSDVAQAILQGSDAIMLSGETASGKYPIKAVSTMANIANEYELDCETTIFDTLHSNEELEKNSISMYITKAAAQSAKTMNVSAIITPTESGFTPRKVSRFKPKVPIIAVVRDMSTFRQLQLSWNVVPLYYPKQYESVDEMIYELISMVYDKNFIKENDKVTITSGHTLLKAGHTNSLEIFNVKTIVDKLKEEN